MKEISAVTLGKQVYPAVSNAGSTANATKGKQSFDSFLNIGNAASTGQAKTDTARAQSVQKPDAAQAKGDVTSQPESTDTTTQVQQDNISGTEASADDATQADTGMESTGITRTEEITVPVNNAIKETVKDITGLDDEALAEIMAALGMSLADLLDMGNLKQFVMYINNTSDVTDLLMDESMMSQLNNLADAIADIDIEALAGMPEDGFMQLLQSMADGSQAAQDNNTVIPQEAGAVQQDTQQADTDIPVIVEYASEEDAKALTAFKETAAASKETVQQDSGNVENGKLQAGKETQEGINTAGQQENLKQDAGGTLAEGTQTEAKPVVHDETFNGQAGFIQNLAQAAADVQDKGMPQQTNMQTMINIVNQVVEQIKVTMGREETSMQLQLNPESLGKVLVSVTSNHGVMTANFTVQSEEAKEALQSQMFALREALESRSLKVDAVEVEVSDFAFSQSSQADSQNQKEFENGSGRRFKFDAGGSGDEEADNAEAVSGRQSTKRLDMGSSIDYTA